MSSAFGLKLAQAVGVRVVVDGDGGAHFSICQEPAET